MKKEERNVRSMNFLLLDQTIISGDVEEKLSFAQRSLESLWEKIVDIFPSFIISLIIFFIGWWLIKLVCKIFVKAMKKGNADNTVISFLHSIVNLSLKIILCIIVLSTMGFDVTTLIATISAAAVTVGLALKDSLANVASGTLIILNQKFKTGDYIETEGLAGEVVKIEMMYTTLRTYDNKEIMIPNSRLTSNNITNYFVRNERRVDLLIPIGYNEDIQFARKVIFKVIESDERVLIEKNNKVAINQLNESSIDLTVWIWCKSEDYWSVKDDMQEKIKAALDENGINIPYNQLDVHLINNNLLSDEKRSKK